MFWGKLIFYQVTTTMVKEWRQPQKKERLWFTPKSLFLQRSLTPTVLLMVHRFQDLFAPANYLSNHKE